MRQWFVSWPCGTRRLGVGKSLTGPGGIPKMAIPCNQKKCHNPCIERTVCIACICPWYVSSLRADPDVAPLFSPSSISWIDYFSIVKDLASSQYSKMGKVKSGRKRRLWLSMAIEVWCYRNMMLYYKRVFQLPQWQEYVEKKRIIQPRARIERATSRWLPIAIARSPKWATGALIGWIFLIDEVVLIV